MTDAIFCFRLLHIILFSLMNFSLDYSNIIKLKGFDILIFLCYVMVRFDCENRDCRLLLLPQIFNFPT